MPYTGKKYKKEKLAKISFFITTCVVALIILLSPYGNHKEFSYKLVKNTIEINAPVNDVFNFLGNSKNTSRWSVFVHHINPLHTDSVPDGMPGSKRRCFCYADEKGRQWDEMITEMILNKKRQLIIYNLTDFPVTAKNLATEQLYESLSTNKCKLTFTVFFKDARPTLTEKIKMYVGAYKIKNILKQNMANIKMITETEKQ